jgi:hypothetical protein
VKQYLGQQIGHAQATAKIRYIADLGRQQSKGRGQGRGEEGEWRWLGAKDHAEPAMHDYQVGSAAAAENC